MSSPKAKLIVQLNRLKKAVKDENPKDLLTEPQQKALTEIRTLREERHSHINLHGPANAGKTFLCWTLQAVEEWEYHPFVAEDVGSPRVIYDHGESKRMATRQLRNNVKINGISTVVYVTDSPAVELYPKVELNPPTEHYDQIRSNWDRLGLETEDAPKP